MKNVPSFKNMKKKTDEKKCKYLENWKVVVKAINLKNWHRVFIFFSSNPVQLNDDKLAAFLAFLNVSTHSALNTFMIHLNAFSKLLRKGKL